MMSRRKRQLSIIFLLVLGVGLLFSAYSVFAATSSTDTFGVQAVGQNLPLGSEDIRITVGKIIRAALGLLALVAVVIILYAGFTYMTAGGNEDKVAESRKLISNAVIGLAIILSAMAIVQFVLNKLAEATGSTGRVVSESCRDAVYSSQHLAECTSGPNHFNCTDHPEECVDSAFIVKSITPQTLNTRANDIKVHVIFNRSVDADVSNALKLTRNGNDVTDEFDVYYLPGSDNKVIEAVLKPGKSICQEEALIACSPSGTYEIRVQTDVVRDRSGNRLATSANGISYPVVTSFKIETLKTLDKENPQVTAFGVDGHSGARIGLARGATYPIQARITDDSGAAYVRVTVQKKDDANATILTAYVGPRESSDSPYDFSYPLVIASNATIRDEYTIVIQAFDIDHHSSEESMDVVVLGELCRDNQQDGTETGVDEGGECSLKNGCTRNGQCDSGSICNVDTGICVPGPVITDVSPWNGAPGNWITIFGKDFGSKVGTVEFGIDKNQDGTIDSTDNWIKANLAACTKTAPWNDNFIVAVVPTIPADLAALVPEGSLLKNKYAIRVTKADPDVNHYQFYRDATNDDAGERGGPGQDGLFEINAIQRPGLCSVETRSGERTAVPNTDVFAYGSGFGDAAKGVTGMSFGSIGNTIREWSSTRLLSRVPANFVPGKISVDVTVNGIKSNGVPFTVLRAGAVGKPVITGVSPTTTTRGSLVTVTGHDFGDSGSLFLAPHAGVTCTNIAEDGCIPVPLPDQAIGCGDTWTSTQVVAQIPKDAPIGLNGTTYALVLRNVDNVVSSGDIPIRVTDGNPLPSICALSHNNGPAPRANISLVGVNFTQTPTVYYWFRNALPYDPSTWLPQVEHHAVSDTRIMTSIPVSRDGYSMITGPVVVRAAGNYSNSVTYTVQDCTTLKPDEIPDTMQCCRSGDDRGTLKDKNLACAGQTREAGYVWRFTTGKIPSVPHVLENTCNALDWAKRNAIVEFPSPTPWADRVNGNNVCVNATVAVKFSEPMNEADVRSANNVKMFRCGKSVDGSKPDCSTGPGGRHELVPNNLINLSYESDVLTIHEPRIDGTVPNLLPDTWYRVELSDAIRSVGTVTVLGIQKSQPQALQKSRPCGDGTAYCFTFKTGTNNICQLSAAGIDPSTKTTNILGLVANPPGSDTPFYYRIWGRSNQACSVMGVDGMGWSWNTSNVNQAIATVDPGDGYKDSRARVEAKLHTAPDAVTIQASADFSHTITNTTKENVQRRVATVLSSFDILRAAGVNGELAVKQPANVVSAPPSADLDNLVNRDMTIQFSLDDIDPNDGMWNPPWLDNWESRQRMIFYKGGDYYLQAIERHNVVTGEGTRSFTYFFRGNDGNMYTLGTGPISSTDWKPVETITIATTDKTTTLYHNGISKGSFNVVYQTSGFWNPLSIGGHSSNQINANTVMKGTVHRFAIDMVSSKTILDTETHTTSVVVPDGQITATSTLTIDFGNPKVSSHWPECAEACTNATIGVSFDRRMLMDSYPTSVMMQKCSDENCTQFIGEALTLESGLTQEGVSDERSLRMKPNNLLDKDSWYQVTVYNTILSLIKDDPKVGGSRLSPLDIGCVIGICPAAQWKFKTKATNDGTCALAGVDVIPLTFTATVPGQRTKYAAIPHSEPDTCSKSGQELDPWQYGWGWSVYNPKTTNQSAVAKVSNFVSAGELHSYCSAQCLPLGSDIARGAPHAVLCGNGTVDPGEDCDIGVVNARGNLVEIPGTSCSFSCLRPGNRNKTTTNEAGKCGNGNIETDQGEECDPGDVKMASYCTDTCTFKPAIVEANAPPLCGDGVANKRSDANNVSRPVEDCDVKSTASDNRGPMRCSPSCVHTGTTLSSTWCMAHADVNAASRAACGSAQAVCGNSVIEPGEECEIGVGGEVKATAATCDDRCLSKNVCGIRGLEQCAKGSDGCSLDCTLLGSSPLYATPSLCGDGVTGPGTGEFAACELPPNNSGLGQNPIQIVTAVGNGTVNEAKQQLADVSASVVAQSTATGKKNVVPPVTGMGAYTLQCGNTEYKTPIRTPESISYNDCPNSQGGIIRGVGTNSCCYLRPTRMSEYPADGAGIAGKNSILIDFNQKLATLANVYSQEYATTRDQKTKDFDAAHIDIAFTALKTMVDKELDPESHHVPGEMLAANEAFATEQDKVAAVFSLTINNRIQSSLVDAEEAYAQLQDLATSFNFTSAVEPIGMFLHEVRDTFNGDNTTALPMPVINAFYRFIQASHDFHDTAAASDIANLSIKLKELEDSLTSLETAMAAYKSSTFPISFDKIRSASSAFENEYGRLFNNGPVCRNTFIDVTLDGVIDVATLQNNVTIAIATTSPACPMGVDDVSNNVRSTLALQATPPNEDGNSFIQFFRNVKQFFLHLFGRDEALASAYNLNRGYIWCSAPITITPGAVYKTMGAGTSNERKVTTVTLTIDRLLDKNTYYAVILQGGLRGIKAQNGVGIRNKIGDTLSDSWLFKTGDTICKISTVSLEPSSHLFTTPNTSSAFIAYANSDSGFIVPIKNQYDWVWSWGPQGHPIFAIPAAGAPSSTASTLIASKKLEGAATAVVSARVTEDKEPDATQSHNGRIFTATADLTANFCEHPWPAPGDSGSGFPYKDTTYNFSMSYCADAGKAGNINDDLPYLEKQVLDVSRTPNDEQFGELRKVLFVDQKTDDAIGMRILKNEKRQTASEWYAVRFPNAKPLQPAAPVDGYDAVTDGNTYYINFLNLDGPNIYNNILVLTVNSGAQAPMRQVFAALVNSLKFNTNLSNYGYCLNDGAGSAAGNIRTNPSNISTVSCGNDFACRDAVTGVAKAGLTGVCSNAKTKFLNDWQRLHDIRSVEDAFAAYYASHNNTYPDIASGSFLPQYTVSYWTKSWSALQQQIQHGLPQDPVNQQTACQDRNAEQSTCWNASNSTYSCPGYSSVYEYKFNPGTKDYQLHGKLEYFTLDDQIAQDILTKNPSVPNGLTHFTTTPWCNPAANQRFSPFGEKCGDGIVNQTNEQCDPPGKMIQSTLTTVTVASHQECADGNGGVGLACTTDANCGKTFSFQDSTGVEKTVYSDSSRVCMKADQNGSNFELLYDTSGSPNKWYAFGCTVNADCKDPAKYSQRRAGGESGSIYTYPDYTERQFSDFKNDVQDSQTNPDSTVNYLCFNIDNGLRNYDILHFPGFGSPNHADPVSCTVVHTSNNQCAANQISTATCNTSCRWDYSACRAATVCGNGIVEASEQCDEGRQMNGTPGHCTAQCRRPGEFCGNGSTDPGEFCDATDVSAGKSVYALAKANSCSLDCKSYGGYCGDNIKQPQEVCEAGYVDKTTELCEKAGDMWETDSIDLPLSVTHQDHKYSDGSRGIGYSEHNTSFYYIFPLERGNYQLSVTTFNWDPSASLTSDWPTEIVNDGACSNIPGVQLHVKVTMFDLSNPADTGKYLGDMCNDGVTTQSDPDHGTVATGLVNAGKYRFVLTWDNEWARLNPVSIDTDIAIAKISLNATRQYLCQAASCTYTHAVSRTLNDNMDVNTYQCVPSATATLPAGGGCGDGIKQDNEACDLENVMGSDGKIQKNGVKCIPAYGKSCSYCSLQCDKVLTVDPVSFCGNGTIDRIGTKADGTPILEACDIRRNSDGTSSVVSSTPSSDPAFSTPSCLNLDVGAYSCNSTCTKLVDSCLACNIKSRGAIPKLAVLNVLTPNTANFDWAQATNKKLYRVGDQLLDTHASTNWPNATITNNGDVINLGNYLLPQWLLFDNSATPSDPQYTGGGYNGLETNAMCASAYGVGFNTGALAPSDNLLFPYPVKGEAGVVQNELVVTPVPRPNEFRVVVRWPKDNDNTRLGGIVYNEESYGGLGVSSTPMLYNLAKANDKDQPTICKTMTQTGVDSDGNNRYWVPGGCGWGLFTIANPDSRMIPDANGSHDSLFYESDIGHLDTVFAQALTIYPGLPIYINNGYFNSDPHPKPYAYVVEGISGPLGQYLNKDVYVDVYVGGKAGAVPKYSIYKPDFTFSLRDARGTSSNSNPKYWHVFDLIKVGNTYKVSTSTTGAAGSLETDWASANGTDGVLGNYAREVETMP